MKKVIDESRMLVNLARALGQQPDPMLVKQVETYDELQKQVQTIEEQIHKEHDVPTQKYLQDIFALAKDLKKVQHTIVEQKIVPPNAPEMSSIQQLAEEMSKYVKVTEDFQQPNLPAVKDLEALTSKVRMIEQWVTNISSTGPGSGEVNFRYLDDVNRSTMTPSNNNWVLEYDAATKKAQFTTDIGPIESVRYDPNHIDDHNDEGVTCWSTDDRTLNIHHSNGVIQQVGQEQYYLARNQTGNTIPNGTVVMYAGAVANELGQRLLMAPFVADGTYPTLYVMGVTTQDVANGENGFVTSFGKVRDVNTTTWAQGDILYANPLVPGGLTNVKPTAPNNVVPVAAALSSTANGEIFVRPTIEQKLLYARFASITDQFPSVIDTPYPIIFGITDIARGFHADGGTPADYSKIYAEESGFFKFDATLSLTSTNSSAKAFYVWMRKNGVDIPRSAKRQSVTGNGTHQILPYTFSTSLNKNDYIQMMYAVSDTTISINAPDATAFCPAIPSATLVCVQIAL